MLENNGFAQSCYGIGQYDSNTLCWDVLLLLNSSPLLTRPFKYSRLCQQGVCGGDRRESNLWCCMEIPSTYLLYGPPTYILRMLELVDVGRF